jgi:hypothetical protein
VSNLQCECFITAGICCRPKLPGSRIGLGASNVLQAVSG